jgi:hypothetical protein
LLQESNDEILVARMSDLDDSEREHLRAAAGAPAAGMVLGADAALGVVRSG